MLIMIIYIATNTSSRGTTELGYKDHARVCMSASLISLSIDRKREI
jgi:hypothetical protein